MPSSPTSTPKHNPSVPPSSTLPKHLSATTSSCRASSLPAHTMSALTPPSFVDDGVSFTKRTRHGLRPSQIADWLNDTESSTVSCSTAVYTGSFVDDGADMLLPPAHGPGFGPIDARFYKQKKRNEGEEGVWNDAVQQAVSGDIQRNFAHIRGLGDIVVRKRDGLADGKDSKEETVTVPVPRKWGTFVIRCDDGRVIVIDETGEYDSGPQGGEEKRREGRRWIKAPSTVEPLLLRDGIVDAEEKGKQARREGKRDESHRRKKTHRQLLSPSAEPLTTIQESEYEDGYEVSDGDDPVSPTFMTGGASGWPSRAPTSVASPARAGSHKLSMPGSWPSPAQPPVKSAARSQQSSGEDSLWDVDKRSRSERSERLDGSKNSGRAHRSHKHRADVVSAKSYSTYKSPAVEDAPSISSQSVHGYKRTGWGGSSRDDDWQGVEKASKKGSHVSWNSSTKSNVHGWGASGKAASESSWDGYEKKKTASEVSVAGSGSERSALSSLAPSRGSGRGRASKMDAGVQKGRNGSPVSKKTWSSKKAQGHDDDGWGGERSKGKWTGWK
ncbi:hypothetical protein J1614_000732 [Plenodomus biglobosus]|nr:hypothetical protein J1614_000732 [Plenodomus biglobosus]